MLNEKSPIAEMSEIGLRQKSIFISFEESHSGVRLILPSAVDLRQLPDARIEWTSMSAEDVGFEDTEIYKDKLNEYKSKYDKYKSNLPFIIKYAQLSDLAGFSSQSESQLTRSLNVFDHCVVKNELVAIRMKNQDFSELENVYSHIDLDSNIEANLRLAQLFLTRQDLESAKECVARAVQIDPTDYQVRMLEGTILLAESRWSSAIRSYRIASESNSESSIICLNLGVAYWNLNEDKKAIKSLKKAVHLDPTSADAGVFLADILLLLNRPVECIRHLEKLIEFEPRNSTVWARLGKAFYDSRHIEGEARPRLKKALEAFSMQSKLSDTAYPWNSIGLVYGMLGEPEKAKRYFTQSLKVQNGNSDISDLTFANLLTSMVESKDYREALKLSKSYIDEIDQQQTVLTKSVSRIYLNYIICLEALGYRSEARDKSEKLLELQFEDPIVKLDLISHVFYHKTVVQPDSSFLERYMPVALQMIKSNHEIPVSVLSRISNNIVFALLVFDRISDAKNSLHLLSEYIHCDAYATATLGLYHLKNNRYEKSKELYIEAMRLLPTKVAKDRMRQRMFFEFGKQFFTAGDRVSTRKFLKKASKIVQGNKFVEKEILVLQTKLNE